VAHETTGDDGSVIDDPLLGRVVGDKYRIDAEIGAGGMATIYRCTRLHIGDTVAVKVLRADLFRDPQFAERFRREAEAAARLKHPNVVAIYDFGVASDGLAYLVMELVDGPNLRTLIRDRGPLPAASAAEIIRQVCAALSEAHRQGIVHRDIKPANIAVETTPDGLRVKVLDFGVASLRGDGAAVNLTQTGAVLGTPAYMSPEQCMGEEIDGRSDIYSLGVVLFEMLCGVVPFNSPTATAVAMQHVQQAPPPLRVLNASITPGVEAVVLRALEKRREDRYQSPRMLADALTAATVSTASFGDETIAGARFVPAPDRTIRQPAVVLPAAQPAPRPMRGVALGVAIGALCAVLAGGAWVAVERLIIKPAHTTASRASHGPPRSAGVSRTAKAGPKAQATPRTRLPLPGAGPSVATVYRYYALWNARDFATMYAMLSERTRRTTDYEHYVRNHAPISRLAVTATAGRTPDTVNVDVAFRANAPDASVTEHYSAGYWVLKSENGRLRLDEEIRHETRPPLLIASVPRPVVNRGDAVRAAPSPAVPQTPRTMRAEPARPVPERVKPDAQMPRQVNAAEEATAAPVSTTAPHTSSSIGRLNNPSPPGSVAVPTAPGLFHRSLGCSAGIQQLEFYNDYAAPVQFDLAIQSIESEAEASFARSRRVGHVSLPSGGSATVSGPVSACMSGYHVWLFGTQFH
jgi:tRNA A-37 threonylcarbamoyl transferase component Bud32